MISLNVCLTDIPKERMRKAKDGKFYADIIITGMKEADKYGNTMTAYMSQSKEERTAKQAKIYVGKAKQLGTPTSEAPQQSNNQQDDDNSLPF